MPKTSAFFALFAAVASVSALPSYQDVVVKRAEVFESRAADDSWIDSILSSHNTNRAAYGASALTWNAALVYPNAHSWAQACNFEHSGGNYAENLYAESGGSNIMTDGMNSWMFKASQYDYNNPVFSSATGHFTQVGCRMKGYYSGGLRLSQLSGWHHLPNGILYIPRLSLLSAWNVIGEFQQNVGRHV